MKKERKWSRKDFTKQERKNLFYLGLESKLACLAADLKTGLKMNTKSNTTERK